MWNIKRGHLIVSNTILSEVSSWIDYFIANQYHIDQFRNIRYSIIRVFTCSIARYLRRDDNSRKFITCLCENFVVALRNRISIICINNRKTLIEANKLLCYRLGTLMEYIQEHLNNRLQITQIPLYL